MQFMNVQSYTPVITEATPAEIKDGVAVGALFYQDDTGQDWYLRQKDWDSAKYKVLIDTQSRVVCHSQDVSSITPIEGHSVYEVATVPEGLNQLNEDWFFINDTFYSEDELKTLEEWRLEYLGKIKDDATAARRKLVNQDDPLKVASYKDKADRANRILNGTQSQSDIDIIEAEIAARGMLETAPVLAAIQSEKAATDALSFAMIDGWEEGALLQISSFQGELASLQALFTQLYDNMGTSLKALFE